MPAYTEGNMKEARTIFLLMAILLLGLFAAPKFQTLMKKQEDSLPTPTQTPTPPTPTPTPRPLTLAEMNALYGPCAYVPTLMYHHVQELEAAKTKKQTSLTVAPDTFRSQMEHIKARGYTTIAPSDLINFFDAGTPLPAKPILLTFDDAYEDFGSVAAPVLREFGLKAISFVPTGLVENPDYLIWSKISELNGWGTLYFANHTWSHRNVAASEEVDHREISTADTQLSDRGLNPNKVFAYPYGIASATGIRILQNLGYKLAFTTIPGSILCRGQRLALPRIRIGNTALSAYGL